MFSLIVLLLRRFFLGGCPLFAFLMYNSVGVALWLSTSHLAPLEPVGISLGTHMAFFVSLRCTLYVDARHYWRGGLSLAPIHI